MTTKRYAEAFLKSTDLLEVLSLELASAESAVAGVVEDILPRLEKALSKSDVIVGKSGFQVTKAMHVKLRSIVELLGDIAGDAEDARQRLEDNHGTDMAGW